MKLSALSKKNRILFQLKTMESLSEMILRIIEDRSGEKDCEFIFTEHKRKIKKLMEEVTNETDSERLKVLYSRTEKRWGGLKDDFSRLLAGPTLALKTYDAIFENLEIFLQSSEIKHVMLEGGDEEKQKMQEEFSKKGKIFGNTRANLHVLASGADTDKILLPDGQYVERVELAFQTIQQQLKKADEEIKSWLLAQSAEEAQQISDEELAQLRLKIFQNKQKEALEALEKEAMRNLREKQNNLMGQMIAAKSLEETSLNKFQTMTFSPGVMVEFFNSATGRWKLEEKEKALKQGRGVSTSFWERFKGNTLKIFIGGNGETEGKLSGYENKKGAGADNLEDQRRILEKVIYLQAHLMRSQRKEGGLESVTLFVNCPKELEKDAMKYAARQGFGKIKSYQQYDIEQKAQDMFHESGTLLDKKYEGQVSHFSEKDYQSIRGTKDSVEKRYESWHATDVRDIYGMREGDVVDLGLESLDPALELQRQRLKNPALFMGTEESEQKKLLKQASPQQIYAVLAFDFSAHDEVPGLELSYRQTIFKELSIGQQAAVLGCFVAKEIKPSSIDLQIKMPIQFENPILVLKILEGITSERAYEIMLAMANHDNIILQSIVGAANQEGLARQFMRCLSQEKQNYILDRASERKQNLFDLLSSARVGPLSQYLRKNKLREAMGLDIDINGEDANKFNDDKTPVLIRAEILDRVVMRYEAGDERSNRHIRAIYKKFYQLCEPKISDDMIAIFNASAHPEKLMSCFLMQKDFPYHKHPKSWGKAQAMWAEENKEEKASAYMTRLLSSEDLSMQTRAVILSQWIALHENAINSAIQAKARASDATAPPHEVNEQDPSAPIHFYILNNRNKLPSLACLLALLPAGIQNKFSKWIVAEIAGPRASKNEIASVEQALKMSAPQNKQQAISVDGEQEHIDQVFVSLEEWATKPEAKDIETNLLRYEKIHSQEETQALIIKLFEFELTPRQFWLVMLAAVRNGLIGEALGEYEKRIAVLLFTLVEEERSDLVVAIFKEMFSKNKEDAFLFKNVEKLMEIIVNNKKYFDVPGIFASFTHQELSEKTRQILFTLLVKKDLKEALNVFKKKSKDADPETLARWGAAIINPVVAEEARDVAVKLIDSVHKEKSESDFKKFYNLFLASLSLENKARMKSLLSESQLKDASYFFRLLSDQVFDPKNPKQEAMLERFHFWAAIILNREDVKADNLKIFKIILVDTVGKMNEEQAQVFRETLLKEIKPERLVTVFTGLSDNLREPEEVNDVGSELLNFFRILCQQAVEENKKEILDQLVKLALMILEKAPKDMQEGTYRFVMQAFEDVGLDQFEVKFCSDLKEKPFAGVSLKQLIEETEKNLIRSKIFGLIKQVLDETEAGDLQYILGRGAGAEGLRESVEKLLKEKKVETIKEELDKMLNYSTFLSGIFSACNEAIISGKGVIDKVLRDLVVQELTKIKGNLSHDPRFLDVPSEIKFLNLLKEKIKNMSLQQEQAVDETAGVSESEFRSQEPSEPEAAGVGGAVSDSRRSSGSQRSLLQEERETNGVVSEEEVEISFVESSGESEKEEEAGDEEKLASAAGFLGSGSRHQPKPIASSSSPVSEEEVEGSSEKARTRRSSSSGLFSLRQPILKRSQSSPALGSPTSVPQEANEDSSEGAQTPRSSSSSKKLLRR
ncbi:MAG: hypothetical protein A3I12_00995 [Gammaproteobacteria bacterium RIFCSPLOWO2_02_FULL_38_11]|nr:MAG: hypothetical protein A2W47_00955 [Gammaproteobacteria bacterium RIFCSPHIGHO2_12_38_15]OGT68879.1 MAG: hypothetical protein A3I12_00995 [Gammaproteobacteria bacterium RIFCSPLOWO2_02_FULL_38_11]